MSLSETICRAIETFVRGFSLTKSFTHPYVPDSIDGLWVMRDAARSKGSYRREEWVAYGTPPEAVDETARHHTRGKYAICAIYGEDETDEVLRHGYKQLGYRLGTTEPLMVHPLSQLPRFDSPAVVVRVSTEDLAGAVNAAAGSRQILSRHLDDDAELRQYAALVDDEPVGWVRSIVVGTTTWCSNMYVKPEYRRRGIARAMMARMLRDDREHGSQLAVLLASHTGALLYPVVGYQRIGTLLLYTPKKRKED